MAISSANKNILNNMNRRAAKASLGTLLEKAQLYAAVYTTVGGAAAEDVTIAGVVATDVVLVSLKDDGTNNVSISSVATATGKITITFSGNPGNDAIVNILVVRPIS